ncbi:unnamed protein product [Calicophoron daubneyi]|uniref:UBA domain-containing protein n=1 Tax=Calicophoron daubneyi TaxID=300641 RepID=A0AAV2TLZ5_CALDB
MPSFKIEIPSTRAESGREYTRWTVNKPIEEVTYELLVDRLRKIVETPTSGYTVTWSDGVGQRTITNTRDLHAAINYFAERNFPDHCVRLRAEMKDTLDVFEAFEILTNDMSQDSSADRAGDHSLENEQSSCYHPHYSNSEECTINDQPADVRNFRGSDRGHTQRRKIKLSINYTGSFTIEPVPPFDNEETFMAILDAQSSPSPTVRLPADNSKQKPPKASALSVDDMRRKQPAPVIQPDDDIPPLPPRRNPSRGPENSARSADISQERSHPSKLTEDDIDDICRQLYMMGYRKDEKLLKSTVKSCRGSMNKILDKLDAMN